jgi:transposase
MDKEEITTDQPSSGQAKTLVTDVKDTSVEARDNERAVKMVFEIRERDGKGHGEIARVARQLDVHPEALRSWLQQAEIDGGKRPGTTADDKQRIAELEKENRELRRANEILKAASAYFARELDPRLPR